MTSANYGRVLTLALAAVSVLAGCQQDTAVQHGEDFPGPGETRSAYRYAEVQAAAGARTDATMRSYHFDKGELNSLGRERLDLMLKDDESVTPLVVYLDAPAEQVDLRDHWQRSVVTYLKDRGLTDEQFKLEFGANPRSVSRAAPAIRGMHQAEDAVGAGGPPANGGPTGSPVDDAMSR
jgi:hypothetical protein